jgi:hypothetical protein
MPKNHDQIRIEALWALSKPLGVFAEQFRLAEIIPKKLVTGKPRNSTNSRYLD